MSEHLRALVVVLTLAAMVFAFAKAPACAMASTAGDFERRRNLWLAITLTAFLAHNYWIYIAVSSILLLFALPRETNKLAMFFFLLFAVPPINVPIPGLGLMEHLFMIDYIKLLTLLVLMPAFLSLRSQSDVEPLGRSTADKLILCFMILGFFLQLERSNNITLTLRIGAFYPFVTAFLPYYVASRSLKDLEAFRDALMAFVVAVMVLCAIGAFELAKFWLLYSSLPGALGQEWGYGDYLNRGANLRAQASTGHSIVLGYTIAVAFGFFLYLQKLVPKTMPRGLVLALLLIGLISPLARGPWVGAAAMLLIFVATGPAPGFGLARLGLFGVVALPLVLLTPFGEKIVDHLPFVGTVDAENVTFRERLLEISIQLILRNPLFGSANFWRATEMEELRQGDGLLDLVNTYLGIGLSNGLVSLTLFVGFFVAIAVGIFNGMRKLADRNGELYCLGQALLATLLGVLIIIFTLSSIVVVPVIYWFVAGLGVGYVRLLAVAKTPVAAPSIGIPAQPVEPRSATTERIT